MGVHATWHACLAGLIRKSRERRGAWSVSANIPVSSLWPWHGFECQCGCEGRVNPQASTCTNDGERCPVVGAALAMAECTASVRSASEAEEPLL
jgi:hypothetical protein